MAIPTALRATCVLPAPSPHPLFFTTWTTSSSARMCSFPTRWGWCFTLEPHTQAYLKEEMRVRWMRLQKSSTEG